MEGSNTNNTGALVATLLIGISIGSAMGLLLAPNKGSVTRKKLRKKGVKVKGDLQDKYDALLKRQEKIVNDKTNLNN